MDSADDAAEYDRMDHSAVNSLFVADLLATGFESGDVLDVGTGTALIPIELCRRLSQCRVMAIDASASMLERARYRVAAAELAARIQLSKVDAKRMPFDDGRFDAMISNSIVHHIPEPIEVLREIVRVGRPGAFIFVRDLMRPETKETVDVLVATYAGMESDRARQLFADSLRAALSLPEIRGLVAELGYDPEHVTCTSDRHWTWSTRC